MSCHFHLLLVCLSSNLAHSIRFSNSGAADTCVHACIHTPYMVQACMFTSHTG